MYFRSIIDEIVVIDIIKELSYKMMIKYILKEM